MQKICAEVQQYLLVKFGNLVALCLPENLKVCPFCVTSDSLLVLSLVKLLATRLQGLHAPAALIPVLPKVCSTTP